MVLVELLAYVGDHLELLPGRDCQRGVSGHRPPPRLRQAPRPPDRLPHARRPQRLGLRPPGRAGPCPLPTVPPRAGPDPPADPDQPGRCAAQTTPGPARSWRTTPRTRHRPRSPRRDGLRVVAAGRGQAAQQRIWLHTWGNRDCCLPRGATSAYLYALQDAVGAAGQAVRPPLVPGDYLLLEEVLGPATGLAADADPAHRQVVRIVTVERIDGRPVPRPRRGRWPAHRSVT